MNAVNESGQNKKTVFITRNFRFRLRYSETGPAWRDGVLEKRMSRCNDLAEAVSASGE